MDIDYIKAIVKTGNVLIKTYIDNLNGIDHKPTEYWFLILQNVEQYILLYEYDNNYNIYKNYLNWFIREWPPRINKKKRLMFPKYWNPPEIVFTSL